MNKVFAFKVSCVIILLVLGLIYVEEWVTAKLRPTAAKAVTTIGTNVVANVPTNMSATVRAGIVVALEHIRDEMAHTSATNDITRLREIEAVLTNVLARP